VSNNAELLARAATRTATRPEFLGWVLDRFVHLEDLSNAELAKRLTLNSVDFARLALCLRPRDQHFESDIREICRKFSIESQPLAEVIRLVDSVHTMASTMTVSSKPGILMAARARKRKDGTPRKLRQDDKRKKS
jgi:hypothetical protein